jgi:hypothetical protein
MAAPSPRRPQIDLASAAPSVSASAQMAGTPRRHSARCSAPHCPICGPDALVGQQPPCARFLALGAGRASRSEDAFLSEIGGVMPTMMEAMEIRAKGKSRSSRRRASG